MNWDTAADLIATREVMLGCAILGVAFVACVEKLLPIMPSYLLLITIGLTSVQDPGQLAAITLATILGSTVGAIVWYGLGRAIGPKRSQMIVGRIGRYVFLPIDRYDRLTELYQRNSFWVTVLTQTIPTVRIYAALPAGVLGLTFIPFVVATIVGTAIWNAPLLTIGYALRNTAYNPITVAIAVVGAILVVEAMVLFMVHRYRKSEW